MSIKAKVNYTEVYRDVPIEVSFTENLDIIKDGFLNEILTRLRLQIDNHQDKMRRRQLRGQPYVGASALAISNIRTLFGEKPLTFRGFGKPRRRKQLSTERGLRCQETTCPNCAWKGCYYCAEGFCPKCDASLPKPNKVSGVVTVANTWWEVEEK